MIRIRPIYAAAGAGLLLAVGSAWVLSEHGSAQPPLFPPAANPYANGIYANGMIESRQSQGIDVALNPEISARVTKVLVSEGQAVRAGQPVLQMDDSVQRATVAQLSAAADAAAGQWRELLSQPRPETLAVAVAQADNAAATLKNAADARAKQERAYALDPRSVSRDALDTARNTEVIAATALKVAQRNAQLIRAGAWHFDIENQKKQADAAAAARDAASALLDKYTLRAPGDGMILAFNATVGSYASPAGVYDPRTQATLPVATFGTPQGHLQVRAYVDEILVQRLPAPTRMHAVMTLRGSSIRIPLHFEHVQPYVSPKIDLSNQRQERVDQRVLPVVFSFAAPKGMAVYPGQMVDIYINGAGQ